MVSMSRRDRLAPLLLVLLAASPGPAAAQALVLDTGFGAGGTAVMTFPNGWWTDWNERNAHLINQGGAFSNSWVVAGSHKTIISGNLFYRRGWGYFSDNLAAGSVGGLASEAGPPITTGGIVQNGSEVTFIGTGAPLSTLDVVDLRRTNVDPFASPSTSCAGGFQAVFSLGQSGNRDEVRGAAPRSNGNFLAVGTTLLADGQSRGFVLSLNSDCTRNTGFGSNGQVILDVNPFVVLPPPRRVRVNAVATYTNGAGQERIAVAGGVRYGLADTSPGACFMAVLTPTGALDTSFDGDGIRLYEGVPFLSPGPTWCDFHALAPIQDASGRGFVTVADWTRDNRSEFGADVQRFTESGAALPGFTGTTRFGGSERGPSTLAIRSDGLLVVGRTRLDNSTGNLLAITDLSLNNPTTGTVVLGSLTELPTGQSSRRISRIVSAGGNRIYVIGTAGPGRFGHDRIVVARYTDGTRTVTVNTLGGGGTVSSSPAGISNCGGPGGTCSAGFLPGTSLTLTATPSPSNRFGNWSGGFAACGTNPACTFTVSSDVGGEAVFIATTNVSIARVGQGGVTSNPAGIVCGITAGSGCSGSFDRDPGFGNQTTFTATPAAGWRFVNWTGDFAACGTGPACALVLNQPSYSATANFAVLGETIFANGFDP
jgi:hypothetical protein